MIYRCDTCSLQHRIYCLKTIWKTDTGQGPEALIDLMYTQIIPFCLA